MFRTYIFTYAFTWAAKVFFFLSKDGLDNKLGVLIRLITKEAHIEIDKILQNSR